MKKNSLSLFIFIDAFGWELQQETGFLSDLLPYRYPLRSIFGYSSGCVPAILTGLSPNKNGYWSGFYYAPDTSPFRFLTPFKWIPSSLSSISRVRHLITRYAKWKLGWNGYLNLYNIPFQLLPYFDYQERVNFYEPKSLSPITTIFDTWVSHQIPYFSFSVGMDESTQIPSLLKCLPDKKLRTAYLAFGKIDASLHLHKRNSPTVLTCVQQYEDSIRKLYNEATKHYDEVTLTVFSDHDMAPIHTVIDLMSPIMALPLQYGIDYLAFYDSTMIRFWFNNNHARTLIKACLATFSLGHFMRDTELKDLGTWFPDGKYGELFYVVNEGVLIIPSFMGRKPIEGMHGYLPDTRYSKAMLLTNAPLKNIPKSIVDIYQVMRTQSEQ